MPQVEPTQITTEESQKQLDAQESMHKDVMSKIQSGDVFKSLDLPVTEPAQTRQQPEPEPVQDEQIQQQTEEEQSQEEVQPEEEVIPKSKIQPRIDKLSSRIKMLEEENNRLKGQSQPVDEVQAKLNAMSESELEDTLTQIRVAKEKNRDNEENLLKIVKLERQIEKTIVQAPQRFAQQQIQEYNKEVERLTQDEEIGDIQKAAPSIMALAKDIYSNPEYNLGSMVKGQAIALSLAAKHYKEVSKLATGKTEAQTVTQNLKGQVNNFKKKTLLDTKSVKTQGAQVNLDRLRQNAMTGSMKDKEKFAHNDPRFKIDAMIPDYLKG